MGSFVTPMGILSIIQTGFRVFMWGIPMLKNKVDKIGILSVFLITVFMVWNSSINTRGEIVPTDVAKMLGLSGLCLLGFSFENHVNPAKRFKVVIFVQSLICLTLSALFWLAILFDYLWGVK